MRVCPPVTAHLSTRRLLAMMALSALLGVLFTVGGLYGSYCLGVASGAVTVLRRWFIFILIFLLAPRKGALWRLLRSSGARAS
ncbi:MAG: hypothetical protein GXX93_10550 [Anaerolineae bacterium]|nr:hypothetical protein [Anaerolineae bacterium]